MVPESLPMTDFDIPDSEFARIIAFRIRFESNLATKDLLRKSVLILKRSARVAPTAFNDSWNKFLLPNFRR